MLFAPFLDKGSGAFCFPFPSIDDEPRMSHGTDTKDRGGPEAGGRNENRLLAYHAVSMIVPRYPT